MRSFLQGTTSASLVLLLSMAPGATFADVLDERPTTLEPLPSGPVDPAPIHPSGDLPTPQPSEETPAAEGEPSTSLKAVPESEKVSMTRATFEATIEATNSWQVACEARVQFENDMMPDSEEGDDDNYTQGLMVRVTNCALPGWRKWLRGKLGPDLVLTTDLGFRVGQNIYTPRDLRRTEPPVTGERPYAAWLYGGAFVRFGGERSTVGLGLDVGVAGRPALGDEVQNGWHSLNGIARTRGWAHQTGTGVLPNLRGDWTRVLASAVTTNNEARRYDLSMKLHGSLGALTNLGLGASIRFGRILGGGAETIAPPVASRIDSFKARTSGSGLDDKLLIPAEVLEKLEADRVRDEDLWEAYWFARGDVRYIRYNAFIQGTPFVDNEFVATPRPFVLDLEVGAAAGLRSWRAIFGVVRRSLEVVGPWTASHVFWELQLAYIPGGNDPNAF